MTVTQTVFMFSGQGSQYFQMGKALYDGNDTFRGWMQRLDEVARQASGSSVIATLYSDVHKKSDSFDRLIVTHPAIFMVEYALAQALMREGVRPDAVLGVSMGSFTAAAIAGFLDVEDALQAVIRQAAAVEESGEAGGMTAILGDPAMFSEDFLGGRSALAAVNFATHFVVSAPTSELAAIEAVLRQRNVTYQRLPITFPFHSHWIENAKTPFTSFMESIRRREGNLPLVCCERAEVVSELSDDYFWDVVRQPMRFREATARLEQQGPRRYVDVGPAGTLATFLKYGQMMSAGSSAHAILTPFGADQKNFAALVAASRN